MITADLLALKAELTNDPTGIGLTVLPADDEANANALNLIRASIVVDRRIVMWSEVDIDVNEFTALSEAGRSYIDQLTRSGQVNPRLCRDDLYQLFGAGTRTRQALDAAFVEHGNRITQMHQLGLLSSDSPVTPSDIANARQA